MTKLVGDLARTQNVEVQCVKGGIRCEGPKDGLGFMGDAVGDVAVGTCTMGFSHFLDHVGPPEPCSDAMLCFFAAAVASKWGHMTHHEHESLECGGDCLGCHLEWGMWGYIVEQQDAILKGKAFLGPGLAVEVVGEVLLLEGGVLSQGHDNSGGVWAP